jgi:rRNA maturation endonuclease Nob1
MTEFCERCKKNVIIFKQEYTTMPQNEDNEVRRYKETFCAICGHCVKRDTVDEVSVEEK